MPPLPLVYLIVDPAPLRPFVTMSRLLLRHGQPPVVVSHLSSVSPDLVASLCAEGAMMPQQPGLPPVPPQWLRRA